MRGSANIYNLPDHLQARSMCAITADTGLRLSRALGLSDMFWINMQARYDADLARAEYGAELDRIHPLAAAG